MPNLGLPTDMPEPVHMVPHLDRITKPFWNWVYNDILHHPLGVQRHGTWHKETAPAEIASFGDLTYQWSYTIALSSLTLATASGAKRTRTAMTDKPRPPFSLLTRCWFDLCLDLDLIDASDWESATDQLERFQTYEKREYGEYR